MCYYNGQFISKAEYIRLLAINKELNTLELNKAIQNGFEFADAAILIPVLDKEDFNIEMAHWEYIPPWCKNWKEVKESRKKFTTLNAIGENLLQSKLYKDSTLNRRCMVLSTGFYEWRYFKPSESKKELSYPYYITLAEKEYFFMAGIWQPWTDKETGETIKTFSIVTTAANSLMQQIHNKKKRMPLILNEKLAFEWMFGKLDDNRINEMVKFQIGSEEMIVRTIAKDFRTANNPTEGYEYDELPALL